MPNKAVEGRSVPGYSQSIGARMTQDSWETLYTSQMVHHFPPQMCRTSLTRPVSARMPAVPVCDMRFGTGELKGCGMLRQVAGVSFQLDPELIHHNGILVLCIPTLKLPLQDKAYCDEAVFSDEPIYYSQ